MSEGSARLLAALLQARTGQQLTAGRRWRIEMALEPLMRERKAATADTLIGMIAGGGDTKLTDAVIDALLNNETSFYRDRTSFDLFEGAGLARLQGARAATRRLRIWCAGCSTGQEAYTLAMIFADQAERWRDWRIDILATDVSRGAIATARAGRYGHFEIQRGLAAAKMVRWFDRDGESWQATARLRAAVRFQVGSLLDAAPSAARFDAILCRNVLLYFTPSIRRLAFSRLAAAIADDGALMLGAGETVLGHTDQFVSDYECRGLYRPRVAVPAAKVA